MESEKGRELVEDWMYPWTLVNRLQLLFGATTADVSYSVSDLHFRHPTYYLQRNCLYSQRPTLRQIWFQCVTSHSSSQLCHCYWPSVPYSCVTVTGLSVIVFVVSHWFVLSVIAFVVSHWFVLSVIAFLVSHWFVLAAAQKFWYCLIWLLHCRSAVSNAVFIRIEWTQRRKRNGR